MSPSERQAAIWDIVYQQRYETVPNLAHTFGVSTRTIYTDLGKMKGKYLIDVIPGRYGGVLAMRWRMAKSGSCRKKQKSWKCCTPGIWLGKPPPDWRNRRRTGAFPIIRETRTGTKTWFAGFSTMRCIPEKKTARRSSHHRFFSRYSKNAVPEPNRCQRQQVVVVVYGLVPLDRLPPGATNKKAPAKL